MAVLTVEQAAPIAGVPAAQLIRWAYDRSGGPRNIGTRHKPRYDEDDVREWRAGKEGLAAVEGALRG